MSISLAGVTTGVLVSIIVWLLRRLLGRLVSIISLLSERSIQGRWKITFWKGEDSYEEFVRIYQVLHWVWGTIHYPFGKQIRNAPFRGTLCANVLAATYAVRGNIVDRGSFTLAVLPLVGRPKKMLGSYSWTDDSDDESLKIRGDRYEWVKV